MAYSVIATSTFADEYDRAVSYILYTLEAPSAAGSLINEMEAVAERLADNPFINAVSRKPTLFDLEYREQLVRGYVVLYRVSENSVYLERFFHQRQDFENLAE